MGPWDSGAPVTGTILSEHSRIGTDHGLIINRTTSCDRRRTSDTVREIWDCARFSNNAGALHGRRYRAARAVGVDPASVDRVVYGAVVQDVAAPNIAREIVLAGPFPKPWMRTR